MNTINKYKGVLYPIVLICIVLTFFWKYFVHGLVPIPADSLTGLYHPFRDTLSQQYPNGIPYKNFLLTDPVRQQYPWRHLAIDSLKKGELPLWNPYSFSGSPLLANLQSAVFYPLNVLFFVFPFMTAWSLLVILQPVLASLFMYLFLRKQKLGTVASMFGGITYAFSGVSIAWLEWNTIGHVILWLPLMLLSVDRVFREVRNLRWYGILIFSLMCSFLAGHIQVFFYLLVIVLTYSLFRIRSLTGYRKSIMFLLVVSCLLVVIATAMQWIPFFQFVFQSARDIDQSSWQKEGWFIPYKQLVQFIAPDFFGNPATLNYWGIWNYAEMIGYVGVIPLMFVLIALVTVRSSLVKMLGGLVIVSLVFATQNPISQLPFQLAIPLLSSAQPTRLLIIVDFALAVLAAIGIDAVMQGKVKFRRLLLPVGIIGVMGVILWVIVLTGSGENMMVAKRNLIVPSGLFVGGLILIGGLGRVGKWSRKTIIIALLALTVFDLFRFGWKFTPFANAQYLYPESSVLTYLQNQPGVFRTMTTDDKILPSNVSVMYGIQSVEGYDPLYSSDYGELISAWVRNRPDISPFSFNRTIAPHDYKSPIANLLNIEYILTFDSIADEGYELLFEEGTTKLFQNKYAVPRAYFAEEIIYVTDKQEAIEELFKDHNSGKIAVVYDRIPIESIPAEDNEQVTITNYSANTVSISTSSTRDRFLVLSDVYYPTWKAFIDGNETKMYRTNYALRGIVVPEGEHTVIFKNSLW